VNQDSRDSDRLTIEVVFAAPERQELISLSVSAGTTVEAAIELSAIGEMFPDEDIVDCQAGIWGKLVERDHVLRDGDRLELYRPLSIDPREARRRLAESGKSMGRSTEDARDPD
jgi:putative ubiquitin-RnfH superfamily antitoxin RatB of RatAB toxin-antitoxin module